MNDRVHTRPVTIAFAGDILPTRTLFADRDAVSQGFSSVLEIVASADVSFGNFEIPLTTRDEPLEKLLNIRADPQIAPDVGRLGFDVVSLANNHSVDHGPGGLLDTKRALDEVGLRTVGAGTCLADAAAPVLIDVDGVRVGFIGFSCLLPTGMGATETRPGIAPIRVDVAYAVDALYQLEEPGDVSAVRVSTVARPDDVLFAERCVEALRRCADLVLVSIHWGFGSGETLADYQRPLAHALVDAGADAVLGHHPHAIHAIELYRGRPVLYAPGTFIGQQVFLEASEAVHALWAAMSTDSYVGLLTFDPDAGCSLRVVPICLDDDRLPRLAAGADFERIRDRLARLSSELGAEVTASGEHLVVEPRDSQHFPNGQATRSTPAGRRC